MGVLDWKLEALSTVMALAALMAMVGTLFPHGGQPLPQWGYGISINTLLSIYTVIFKTALLYVLSNCILQLQWAGFATARPLGDLLGYDQASRGAWGSWLWLYSHRLREPAMGAAALLTIISLAIDPFAQQLVKLADCQSSLGDMNATLPRTNSLMDGNVADEFFFGRWATSAGFDTSAAAAMASSLVCGTGNCTFPEYTTLGYCSACTDLSDTMTFAATSSSSSSNESTEIKLKFTTKGRWPEPAVWVETITFDSNSGDLSTDMSFLNGVANSHWAQREDGGMDVMTSDADVQILMPGNYFAATGTDPNTGTNITGCDSNNGNDSSPSPSWRCRGYGAATCSLQKCARAYTATVENGRLTETLVASSAGVYWGGNPRANMDTQGSGLLDTACLTSAQKNQLNQLNQLNQSGRRLDARFVRYTPQGWNVTDALPTELAPLDAQLVAQGCLFLAFQATDPQLDFNLVSLLQDPPVKARGWYTYAKLVANPQDGHNFDLSTVYATSYNGSSQLLSMWNGGDVSFSRVEATFANLSDSLTAYVRVNGDAGNASAPARGRVLHYAVCLEVRWAWIALPAALWVCMAVLLAFVARSASLARQPLWKDSAFLLGWIYRGPQLLLGGSGRLDARAASMEKQAAGDIVVLDGGWGGRDPRIRAVVAAAPGGQDGHGHGHGYGHGGDGTVESSMMLVHVMPRDSPYEEDDGGVAPNKAPEQGMVPEVRIRVSAHGAEGREDASETDTSPSDSRVPLA